MQFLFFLIDILFFYWSWKKYRDVLNPITITSFIWGFFLLLYNVVCLTSDNYRFLGNYFYFCIISYLTVFSLICYLITNGVKRNNEHLFLRLTPINVSLKILNIIVLVTIIANIYYILILFKFAGTYNIIQAINNIRLSARGESAESFSTAIKLGSILFNFTPLILCYIFLYDIKIRKSKIFMLVIEMFFISLLLATKGRILRFTILIIIILKKKLSKKHFNVSMILFLPISVLLLVFLTIGRDITYFNTYTINDYIFLYLLSPLPAFDRLISGELTYYSNGFGVRTFEYIYDKIISPITGFIPTQKDPGYIFVPTSQGMVTTNVETVLGAYYMDFGYFGVIICAIIMATIFGYTYKKMVKYKKSEYAVFFVLNVPYLMFQTFGDFLIPTISITIQEYLSVLILGYILKKVKLRM